MTKAEQQWVEISVEADAASVDDLVNLFGRCCSGGAIVEERLVAPGAAKRLMVKGFLPIWDTETRRTLEVALLLLGRVSPLSEPRSIVLKPEDWAESWKAFFPPQHIGAHTVIVPTWHTYVPQAGEVVIHLDPGMAFGTGLHASTRLCLAAIERWLRPGMGVLDVGTGSGILAIAAALQGAARVQALDNDPVAVKVAQDNVALNKVEGRVSVALGTLGNEAAGAIPIRTRTGYDLLLVNIFAEVITGMAAALGTALRAGGSLIAAGIIAERAAAVIQALQAVGLVLDERLDEDGWVALVCHKL